MIKSFIVLVFLIFSANLMSGTSFINFELRSTNNEVKRAISEAAQAYNIKYSTLSKIAWIESKFNPKAKNRRSSAKGLFQIIRKTEVWLRKICKYQKKGNIYNPRVNAYLGACYLEFNQRQLRRKLRKMPSESDLYISHFLGLNHAIKFIKADRNTLGYKIFPRVARYNPYIFFKRGVPRTIRQINQLFINKMKLAKVL